MADYADTAAINALVAEQNTISAALALLDDEGTVDSVLIGPTELSTQPGAMRISVATPDAPHSLVAGVRSGLVQRYNAINRELRDLGVTNTPPDHAPGQPKSSDRGKDDARTD